MVALIFNAPPIDHTAVDLGDNEWITKDGEVLAWSQMSVHHLMGAYKVVQTRIEHGESEIDAGYSVLSYISGEQASYDIDNQLRHLENVQEAAREYLADLKQYVEYRLSIGNVHGS